MDNGASFVCMPDIPAESDSRSEIILEENKDTTAMSDRLTGRVNDDVSDDDTGRESPPKHGMYTNERLNWMETTPNDRILWCFLRSLLAHYSDVTAKISALLYFAGEYSSAEIFNDI